MQSNYLMTTVYRLGQDNHNYDYFGLLDYICNYVCYSTFASK